jgi:hypothetical protein
MMSLGIDLHSATGADKKALLEAAANVNSRLDDRSSFWGIVDAKRAVTEPLGIRMVYVLGALRLGYSTQIARARLMVGYNEFQGWLKNEDNRVLYDEACAVGLTKLEETVMVAAEKDANLALNVLGKRSRKEWGDNPTVEESGQGIVKTAITLMDYLNQNDNERSKFSDAKIVDGETVVN